MAFHVAEDDARELILSGRTYLGIELGSTRIKSVLIDENFRILSQGSHDWENRFINGLWTYSEEDIWSGLQDSYASLAGDVKRRFGLALTRVKAAGFSAMMHGYLAFDQAGCLLVPFRTWRNTNTGQAHEKLSRLFQYNIPERWSIAHLYQAVLDDEEHVGRVAYVTTLAGYVHWKLTGSKVLGISDASGMFPVDPQMHTWEQGFLERFSQLPEVAAQPWDIRDILPFPLVAGKDAGRLTEEGALLLDPTGVLQAGIPLAPPEGDAGTGMVATNTVRPRSGNVSAGTSIFATVVLERKLRHPHPEVDVVATPCGDLAGMSHANNFTSDLNAWVGLFKEFAQSAGLHLDDKSLYSVLFRASLVGKDNPGTDPDAGGLMNYCFYSGEFLAGLEQGRPLFMRSPQAHMTLGNFMRAQLFSAFSPVKIGMDVMTKEEGVRIDCMVGHGGIFATPLVDQRILAAVFQSPIKVMSTAAEGGAWGMAVLAAYLMQNKGRKLEDFLDDVVFAHSKGTTETPDPDDSEGFRVFFHRFVRGLPVERTAIEAFPLESRRKGNRKAKDEQAETR